MRSVAAALTLGVCLAGSAGCELMVAGPRVEANDVWERSYELGATPHVSIANTNGAVTVDASDGDRVEVRAERSVKAVSEQGAQQLLEATTIAEEVGEGTLTLTTKRPPSFSMGQHAEVRYAVRVPRGASLNLRTTNGALVIDGVQGVVDLETVNGRIRGVSLKQVRRTETVNGSVDLSIDQIPAAGAQFETVNGSVELSLPGNVAADVEVRTVNGSISVNGFDRIDEGERRRRRYDGRLNGGGPSLRVETVNGSVAVRASRAPASN